MSTYVNKQCSNHGFTKHRLVKYKTGPRFRCIKCDSVWNKKYTQKLKQQCVEYKGGSCRNCGYNKYIGALDFHHIDPSEKDFSFSKKKAKWETLKAELDKCILLCANCHREAHANENC
jgi:hypothetical protein